MSRPGRPTRAVYTALIGHYEELNEQPIAAESEVPFICFTDDRDLRSDSWEIVLVEPEHLSDPVRSSRRLKILGHPNVTDLEQTLYIDNSVVLRVPPEEILDGWLAEADLAVPEHSFREQVADEFEAVVISGFDDPARVYEQARHYFEELPDVMEAKPLWSAIIARRRSPIVTAFERRWFDDVLRYSRRDQLSMVAALQRSPALTWRSIPLDNLGTALHAWPVAAHRDRAAGRRTPGAWQQPVLLELRSLRRRDEEWTEETDELRLDLMAAQEQSSELVASIDHRESQIRQLESELAVVRSEAARSSEEAGQMSEEYARIVSEHERVVEEIAAIRRSRSWRFGRALRRGFRMVVPDRQGPR